MLDGDKLSYNVANWFWIVGGDEARAWSSAAGAYVAPPPADRVTRIATEIELSEVLRPHGLVLPAPSAADVKAECRRRILTAFPEWKQSNMTARSQELDRIQSGFMRDPSGARMPARDLTDAEMADERAIGAAWAWIKATRAKSDEIEAMDPIPADYTADAMWT